MITAADVDTIERTIGSAFERLPAIVGDIRATVRERDQLKEELTAARHDIDTMNVTVMDLREDKKTLDQRIGALLAENARLEHALVSIGNAVKQSTQVQDSIAQLAAQTNGKAKRVIEHEPAKVVQ